MKLHNINLSRMSAEIIFHYHEGDVSVEEIHQVHIKMEVCPECEGTGRHLRESLRGAFTSSDFDSEEDMLDFVDECRSGVYDVQCETCRGQNVIAVAIRDSIEPDLLKKIEQDEEEEDEFRRLQEAERRMGC